VTSERPINARAELQVLMIAVRSQITPQNIADVRGLLRQPLDWEFLLRQAHANAVLPLLRRGIHAHFEEDVPAAALDTLRVACEGTQRRNLALTAELLDVMRRLEEKGIAVLPFKGPVLAEGAYGNISLRTFGDLDLLLREEQLPLAQETLTKEGYRPEYTFTPGQERAFRRLECAVRLRHPGRNVVVELHWALTERYLSIRLPVERFWESAQPAIVAGRAVRTFGPEDLLLYLCVHGSKHQWGRLEWICCIAELMVAQPDLNWSEVQARSREFGVQRLLHLALILASELLQVEAPPVIRPAMEKDRTAWRLARQIERVLFQPKDKVTRDADRGSWYFYLLCSRECWADRVRIILFSSIRQPHPSSGELVALPAQLSFLYYVFRPLRLLSASVAGACHYVFGERKAAARSAPLSRETQPERPETICTR
jgi:Uncharacterised nucleotidyltransferase